MVLNSWILKMSGKLYFYHIFPFPCATWFFVSIASFWFMIFLTQTTEIDICKRWKKISEWRLWQSRSCLIKSSWLRCLYGPTSLMRIGNYSRQLSLSIDKQPCFSSGIGLSYISVLENQAQLTDTLLYLTSWIQIGNKELITI